MTGDARLYAPHDTGSEPRTEATVQACPLCGSTAVVRMAHDWQGAVNQGEAIPIVGCGNPWHYVGLEAARVSDDRLREAIKKLPWAAYRTPTGAYRLYGAVERDEVLALLALPADRAEPVGEATE